VDENLHPNFVSFTPAETDTIILKRYSKNGTFLQVLDSATFTEGDGYRIEQKGDTISFPIRLSSFSLNPNFDYILSLPAANSRFRISDIDKEQIQDDCSGKTQCVNPARSLKINGVPQSLNGLFYNFYIHK
jgi:hypothetical protein